jgi:hypothetical protein
MRPDIDLLLRAAEPDRAGDRRFQPGPEDIDWGFFLDAAFRHRVAAMAGVAFAAAGYFEPDSRYEYVQDALLAAYALNDRRNRLLLAEARRLIDLLAAAGIDAAVRKGVYLTPAVYRDTGLRPMNDIDLFVDRSDSARVAAVLREAGFVQGDLDAQGCIVPLTRRQAVFWSVHVNNLPTHNRPGPDRCLRSIPVDVSFDLFLPASGCDLPAERLLGEAVTVEVEGRPIRVFRPEHFLLDVAAHLYKESTTLRYIERGKHQRLLQYVDIVAVVRAHPALDWGVLVDTARAAGAARNVYFALANAEELYPSTVPAAPLAELAAIGGVDGPFLRQYGAVDLPEPLTWTAAGIAERLFSDERPAVRSQSPV